MTTLKAINGVEKMNATLQILDQGDSGAGMSRKGDLVAELELSPDEDITSAS